MTNQKQIVYVQQTCTDAELTTAGIIGLVTAGPLGFYASYRVLKEFQGKWGGWFAAGIVGVPLCLGIQFVALGVIGGLMPKNPPSFAPKSQPVTQLAPAPAVPVAPPSLTVAQSALRNLDSLQPQPSSPERIALLHSMFENDPFAEGR